MVVKIPAKYEMASSFGELTECRRRLARIRCVQDCIECFKLSKPLPESVCYVPAKVEYKVTRTTKLKLLSAPEKDSNKVADVPCSVDSRVIVTGEEHCNSEGLWAKVLEVVQAVSPGRSETSEHFGGESWCLLLSSQSSGETSPALVEVTPQDVASTKHMLLQNKPKECSRWQEVTEATYALRGAQHLHTAPADVAAVERLRHIPATWSLDHDDDLAQFLTAFVASNNEHLGSIKSYVDHISVSSSCDASVDNLTDGDDETFWESDGHQGLHWIRLNIKKNVIIKKLYVGIDSNDENYMPEQVVVFGGDVDNMKEITVTNIDQELSGVSDILILEEQTVYHPIIEIKITECKDDGIDARIHSIKIKSGSDQTHLGLSFEHFTPANLVRYPKLENFDLMFLYRRSLLLQRYMELFDSVLSYLVPSWEYSVGSYSSLEVVRQFLPLSKKRQSLAELFLKESETGRPSRFPKLYINRRAAAEHKDDPSLDPEAKNSVFMQIYEGLKPRDSTEKTLDYRWPLRYDQWWECKFLSEGIIDQGGGFRDSLSDLAEELCPSASDVPLPLPFFIRTPNQTQVDSNVNRDVYIPNPSCRDFHKYEWLGKLMGACLRGQENLVLSLPSFVWKRLAGERVTWCRDYVTVDEAEVKAIENMQLMDADEFETYFGCERVWAAVLSDGDVVNLRPHGMDVPVLYEERCEYARKLQDARMSEADAQIIALREGLLQVVPQAVLDLMTWQELERRICGNPEVSVAGLKQAAHYEDLEESDPRVKYMWEALTNFCNEDRSRFLRFVTGRRRLPAPLYICPDKGDVVDALPEASTCSHMLYLPYYTSAKVAEEKLRYAAYNCIAIDTDMSPWDE